MLHATATGTKKVNNSTTQTLHEDDPAHFGTLERIDTFHFRKVIEQE